jgi:hypothetical protein
LVTLVERACGDGCERYTFIGWPKQEVEIHLRMLDSLGVIIAQSGKIRTGIEQTGIEKIWTYAAGFQSELTKFQHAPSQAIIEKLGLESMHIKIDPVSKN